MSCRKPILTLTLAAALAAAALPVQQAAATTPVYVAAASAGAAPWPVWLLGGGVASLMLRAAYVYRTQCRELTVEEAFTGTVPLWPAYQQSRNQCAPAARAPVVGRY
jgi:hypothetical protein